MPGFVAPTTGISQGLQSERSVQVSSSVLKVIGSAFSCPYTHCTPLACFGNRLNEKRKQCWVIISDTSPGSRCAS